MHIASIAISKKVGTKKVRVDKGLLVRGHGLEGDAHSGAWHRQVSFLAAESIRESRRRGLHVTYGDFAENIASEGVRWSDLPVGIRLKLGESAIVEITQIGKECSNKCAIYYMAGDCIMPREGIFAKVIEGGTIKTGDNISILE